MPYLTPAAPAAATAYDRLVTQAIEGDDTFRAKRERIDEYGWRNFGDLYADHEAVFHRGAAPLVSHYNNQYDGVAGFACQFFRSGDLRWWLLMRSLAEHVIDIDVYHATEDKAAYSGGFFWHTYHYVDAGRSSHRSYPRAAGVPGGGPSSEHNYTTGLMLYHFLTGDERARETVVQMGRWVLQIDDGRRTPFRWLDRGPTGGATATAQASYHGPGRGAGNSVAALLNAYRLSRDPVFLETAGRLIRRCIHPRDDIAARNLLDAERRWSYTVFLQVLGRYLDDCVERGELGAMYAWARESLLEYARWMVAHERPYLDTPEQLEYPTETWAAQDIRKSDVLLFASRHAPSHERGQFLERAAFFFRYATETLTAMPARSLTRPVVILLTNGMMYGARGLEPRERAPEPVGPLDAIPPPQPFVPQRQRALARAKILVTAGALAGGAIVAALLLW
jgi:hypothetical protein